MFQEEAGSINDLSLPKHGNKGEGQVIVALHDEI